MSGQVLWQARDVILSRDKDITGFEGQTIRGADSTATSISYSLLTNYGWTMRLAYLHWETGEREMRALDCNSTEHRMHDMCNRLRMSVSELETNPELAWMELSQARLTSDSDPIRTTKKKASAKELLEGSRGIPPQREFEKLGAQFGTRVDLLGDTGTRRTYLCTVFPVDDNVAPAVSFVLTRVLPVWHRYGA